MLVRDVIKNIKVELKGNIKYLETDFLTYDSKKVKEKTMFFCLKGENSDGHNFAKEAEKNGAVAIVCEKQLDVGIPQIIVNNCRKAFALACGNFYGNPANKLKIIAITGTNGKTTTTYMLRSILESAGKRVGLIGTQGAYIGEQLIQTELTTPDPQVLHKIFRTMVDFGIEYVVMEASAHALALDKLEGIEFETGIFTNLTQDHLDYFKSMSSYRSAKLKLFDNHMIKSAVLNFDDKLGIEISKNINVPYISYALNSPSDVFAVDVVKKSSSSEYVINLCDEIFNVKSNLLGEFNIYNSLAAATAASVLGVSIRNIKKGLEKLERVPGRFNSLSLVTGATAIVDFAHTPDSIEKVLTAIKQLPFKRIITVFGCGGNRDKGKRPQMGAIAERLSDFVVITSDNPRFENPDLIIQDIERGMASNKHICIVDRKEAINFAMNFAGVGDVIAICGKGAEEYQDINGVKSPYNDFDVIIEKNEDMGIGKMINRG